MAISAYALNQLGIPKDKTIMDLAMRHVNIALAHGVDPEDMQRRVLALCHDPASMLEDPVLVDVAKAWLEALPRNAIYFPRETPAPWRQWSVVDIDDLAQEQMRNACRLTVAVRGALMPDAHPGYGLPIGGVLAVRNAVIPYAVGKDIACRMRLTVLDMPVSALTERREDLIRALETETRFGVGAGFGPNERRQHAVMDEDWSFCQVTKNCREKAWVQLGSSGSGNHFVEFGELHLEAPAQVGETTLEKGTYLALLSHSGSRGTGEAIAGHYSNLAQELQPSIPQELKALAWLSLDSAPGQEYWQAMQLMGRYASANHELIHGHILKNLGAEALTSLENHHNFAWMEEHDGETLVVHRKGATPAGCGVQGVVPGSMGTPGFVVRGKGNEDSLHSCSHGAGRCMTRAQASRTLNREEVQAFLREHGVELLSGGLDESPMAYKDIHTVMAGQTDLIDIVARFDPRLVKMSPMDPPKKRRPGQAVPAATEQINEGCS